jgi:hypothetical protein
MRTPTRAILLPVESVYCDSEDFAIWRSGVPRAWRATACAGYNGGGMWFLEEKLRLQQRVWKRRAPCVRSRLRGTVPREACEHDGCLPWFADRFRHLRLRPASVICVSRATPSVRRRRPHHLRPAGEPPGPLAAAEDPFAAAAPPRRYTKAWCRGQAPRSRRRLLRELAQRGGTLEGGCSKYGRAVQVLGLGVDPLPPA